MDVVAAVLVRKTKVMVFKKKNNCKYEFPGGKVETFENNEDALVRELKEELGIDAVVTEYVGTVEENNIRLHCYIVKDFEGSMVLKEHDNYLLADQSDIFKLDLAPMDRAIAELLFSEKTALIDSPAGTIYITGNYINITSIGFESNKQSFGETEIMKKAKNQLVEYFEGKRRLFDLPLYTSGTKYQKHIWDMASEIPYGTTKSYIELHKGARAVGNALNRNRHIIIIPCHRVTAKNSLGGYKPGQAIKEFLLKHERDNL